MKLVDILARELKVWPEDFDAAGQACDGSLHKVGGNHARDRYTRDKFSMCDNYMAGEIVTRAQWQAAVDALKADAAPAWVGIGLPPIGVVCECHLPGELTNNYSWVEAKVIWHNGPTECAVIRSTSKLAWCDEFRPIRTPEQIAAEEHEREVELAFKLINETTLIPGDFVRQSILRHAIGEMIKAGYRKQVQL